MTQWKWVREDVVFALHEEQLAEHGGAPGVRDEGLLQSALSRPLNLASYGDPGAVELAANYAFVIARNHPFIDGNKRSAAITALVFLTINEIAFEISEADLLLMTLGLAAGDLGEDQVASWFRERIV